MASKVKEKLSKATSSSPSSSPAASTSPSDAGSEVDDAEQLAEKYKLRVTAGPSYDTSKHLPVKVNSDDSLEIETDAMLVKLKVRVRDYTGFPLGSSRTTPYFDDPMHKRDQYSVAFSFVPKHDIPGDQCIWGNDFDHPIRNRLPPGFNTAFRIVKQFIDPGLTADAYADEPWLYGPALSCWFALRIGDPLPSISFADLPPLPETPALVEGGDGTGAEVRARLNLPDANEKRRRFFLSKENREKLTFEAGRLYQVDFFNPYLDFNRFALRLPGFSISVIKYIDDKSHKLRYVFKNEATGDVYFVVLFTLLFGDELRQAWREEKEALVSRKSGHNGVEFEPREDDLD